MPHVVPKLTAEQRIKVRAAAEQFFKDGILAVRIELLCLAILEFIPEEMVPQLVANPDDKTLSVMALLPPGGVLGVMSDDSSGVCEAAEDDSQTRRALVDHTSMVRNQDGSAFVVKRGSEQAVPVPYLKTPKRE